MPGHDLIVVGASAGGVEALVELARGLPRNVPAAICVVLHLPADSTSMLPQILGRAGALPAAHARDGEILRHGHVYVAPPDSHLVVEPGRLRLLGGPRENGHRRSVDVLFRTAAQEYGSRVIGVVLSGTLDDGTAGLLAIKRRGGLAVVQQPADARYPGMPQSALEHVVVDQVLPVRDIPAALSRLARETVPEAAAPPSAELEEEIRAAEVDLGRLNRGEYPGAPSVYTCRSARALSGKSTTASCCATVAASATPTPPRACSLARPARSKPLLWAGLRALEEKASLALPAGPAVPRPRLPVRRRALRRAGGRRPRARGGDPPSAARGRRKLPGPATVEALTNDRPDDAAVRPLSG